MIRSQSNSLYPKCPIRNVLARISDKWSMLILYVLTQKSPLRFGEIQNQIEDATPKMLTSSLRTLEEDGIISRTVYAEVPPRVEYSITERGKGLMDCMQPLIHWANTHSEEILYDRIVHVNNSKVAEL